MDPNELAGPAGDSFKFENVGDTIEGEIVYVGDIFQRINKFNNKQEKVLRIGIDVDNGKVLYIWPVVGSVMSQAIAEACRTAHAQLVPGHTLKLGFTSEKDVGKGNPLKIFKAKITPGVIEAVDYEEPF